MTKICVISGGRNAGKTAALSEALSEARGIKIGPSKRFSDGHEFGTRFTGGRPFLRPLKKKVLDLSGEVIEGEFTVLDDDD